MLFFVVVVFLFVFLFLFFRFMCCSEKKVQFSKY